VKKISLRRCSAKDFSVLWRLNENIFFKVFMIFFIARPSLKKPPFVSGVLAGLQKWRRLAHVFAFITKK